MDTAEEARTKCTKRNEGGEEDSICGEEEGGRGGCHLDIGHFPKAFALEEKERRGGGIL